MTFAELLKKQLDEKGWGVQDLAVKSELSLQTVRTILKGAPATEYTLNKLCKAVGINPNEIQFENPDENMTISEVARRLKKSESYVKDCINRGTLPGSTDGRGKYHIPRVGFENYMQGINQRMIESCINVAEGIMYEMLNSILKNAPSNQEQRIR